MSPKRWRAKSSMWWKNKATIKYKVEGDRLKLRGWVVLYRGKAMEGLTGGLLAKRFYPTFNRDRATKVTTTRSGRGIPLCTRWIALTPHRGKPSVTAGIRRGNTLNKHVAAMVYFHQTYQIPLEVFGMVQKQQRHPIRAGRRLINPYNITDEEEKKALLSLLNSSAPHLPLLVTKLIELGIDPDGYEIPVIDPEHGKGTRIDLTGIRVSNGKRVNMELKTGGDSYIDNYCGMLTAPYQTMRSNTLNHWLLQLAYSQSWYHKTYRDDDDTEKALLIRVSRLGCFHYFLPSSFSSSSSSLPPLHGSI